MKNLLIIITLLVCNQIFACKTQEALVSAEVTQIKALEDGYCVASLGEYDYFSEHVFCPLTAATITKTGVTLAPQLCDTLVVGSNLDGVLVQLADGSIILD